MIDSLYLGGSILPMNALLATYMIPSIMSRVRAFRTSFRILSSPRAFLLSSPYRIPRTSSIIT